MPLSKPSPGPGPARTTRSKIIVSAPQGMQSGWGRFLQSLCLGPLCLGLPPGGGPRPPRLPSCSIPSLLEAKLPVHTHTSFPAVVRATVSGLQDQNESR